MVSVPELREVAIDDIEEGDRLRGDLVDVAGLARSIEADGLMYPLLVTEALELIDGARRLTAVAGLGWETAPVLVYSEAEIERVRRMLAPPAPGGPEPTRADALRALEIDANVQSEPFALDAVYEGCVWWRAFYEGREGRPRKSAQVARVTGRTSKLLAKRFCYGYRTIEKLMELGDAAKDQPAKCGELFAEAVRTNRVDGAHRKLARLRLIEQINAEPVPLLGDGPYRVIVADPPWDYGDAGEHALTTPYPPMSTAAICDLEVADLPVGSRAHDDALLFLWTTNTHMEQAYAVTRAWGFDVKTILTWAKPRATMTRYLRGRTEHALVAARGNPTHELPLEETLLRADAPRVHSTKPDAFYELVERTCPGAKLELFARRRRPGWTVWGPEVEVTAGELPETG